VFKKILIANRGEIALRVMRTCEDMRIGTVAIYSEADRLSPHVRYADEAYLLGPPPAKQSYLRFDAIIEAVKKSGAEAIHPGYGFLAENADFAETCEKAGVTFIGPNSKMIRSMGDKLSARRLMEKAGVPIVPGVTVAAASLDEMKRMAKQIGYPVLMKPSGGGGGKGMHIVHKEEELEHVMKMAQGEAASSFGTSTVYLEKYLRPVRHIELQVLRDNHGNAIHLGERECSVQRRHQKIIEESPSVAVTPEIRAKLVKAGLAAVEAVNYSGVGTCEFLLTTGGDVYFLEMNTRLQVEHTVTEMVTGLDLVEEQILVADNQKLRHKQSDIKWNGWAMECRISAEDPYNNFMPSPGLIALLSEPGGPGVRVDSGVSRGFEIPVFYDPLIAKLITWGHNREQAVRRMRRALGDYKILGIQNNIPFLQAIIRHKKFLSGDIHTMFLDENADLFQQEQKKDALYAAIAATLLEHQSKGEATKGQGKNGAKTGGASLWKSAALGQIWDRPWR